jgi:hypothetical protein
MGELARCWLRQTSELTMYRVMGEARLEPGLPAGRGSQLSG